MDDAEETVEAGEDFLDEFGRIIVNVVVGEMAFVEIVAPPVKIKDKMKSNNI